MRFGWTPRDIGDRLTWTDLRAFIRQLPPTGESAVYRAQHPKSWWWTAEIDFLAANLHALQSGNWQRGGGRGPQPKPVTRPKDPKPGTKPTPTTLEEARQRKQALADELERRRQRKAT